MPNLRKRALPSAKPQFEPPDLLNVPARPAEWQPCSSWSVSLPVPSSRSMK